MVVLQVVDVYFPKHPVTNQRQAFCFVTFSTRKVTTKHRTDTTYHAFITSVLLLLLLLELSCFWCSCPSNSRATIGSSFSIPIKPCKTEPIDACRLQMLLFLRAIGRSTASWSAPLQPQLTGPCITAQASMLHPVFPHQKPLTCSPSYAMPTLKQLWDQIIPHQLLCSMRYQGTMYGLDRPVLPLSLSHVWYATSANCTNLYVTATE